MPLPILLYLVSSFDVRSRKQAESLRSGVSHWCWGGAQWKRLPRRYVRVGGTTIQVREAGEKQAARQNSLFEKRYL